MAYERAIKPKKEDNMLRLIKGVFGLLLLTAFVLVTGQTALAARTSEVATGNFLDEAADKNAVGTKWEGPLTIYYEVVASNPSGCDQFTTNMFIFLRLRHGSTLRPFSGMAANICYSDLVAQNTAIKDFVGYQVMPIILDGYAYDPGAEDPGFALKSTDQVVENEGGRFPGCCGVPEMLFTIMDVLIAVE
jgi:hypothetical protein